MHHIGNYFWYEYLACLLGYIMWYHDYVEVLIQGWTCAWIWWPKIRKKKNMKWVPKWSWDLSGGHLGGVFGWSTTLGNNFISQKIKNCVEAYAIVFYY
jgi:hypothetical protein